MLMCERLNKNQRFCGLHKAIECFNFNTNNIKWFLIAHKTELTIDNGEYILPAQQLFLMLFMKEQKTMSIICSGAGHNMASLILTLKLQLL